MRVIDQAGGSLVDGAAKIERFLRGEAVEEQTAVEKPRWTVGQELNRADLKQLTIGAKIETDDGRPAYRTAEGYARQPGSGSLSAGYFADRYESTLVRLP